MQGTVKWFNADKGFGFITALDGGNDIFVHIRDVHAAGLQILVTGETVSFDQGRDDQGRAVATNLSPLASVVKHE